MNVVIRIKYLTDTSVLTHSWMLAHTPSLGKRFPLWSLQELSVSYTWMLTLSWVSPSPGATYKLLLLTTGRGHGQEWRGGSSSRCLLMLRRTAPPTPRQSTVYQFEFVIWGLVCHLGLHRVGQCGTIMWCMGLCLGNPSYFFSASPLVWATLGQLLLESYKSFMLF